MARTAAQRSATYRKRNPASAKARNREAQQRWRDANRAPADAPIVYPEYPANPAKAMAEWVKETLIIPPIHANQGQAFALPKYLVSFFADSLAPDCMESLLCIARKNSKSGAVACFLIACILGPLRRAGWRAGVASLSREKASELKSQIRQIATCSGLPSGPEGITVWGRNTPAVEGPGGSIDILSADANSGSASSYDLAICDELGLMSEKHRGLVNSLRSSVSARGGKFWSLTVHGSGPFVGEILSRSGAPGLVIHHYKAPADCKADDVKAWHAANPGLKAKIKSVEYMRAESARALATPSDMASFRAFDLNQPGEPSREMVCSPADWKNCTCKPAELPKRAGPAYLGFDAGGAASQTAAAILFPESGRLELHAAIPAVPSLLDRGVADGVGAAYELAHARGELQTFSGRVTPVGDFMMSVAASLDGCEVAAAASDRYRQNEVLQTLSDESLSWDWRFRAVGSGPDGSADLRSFQRAILRGSFQCAQNMLMPLALRSARLRRDGNGNPSIDRAGSGARIDILSAAVLAFGLAESASDDGGFGVSRVALA